MQFNGFETKTYATENRAEAIAEKALAAQDIYKAEYFVDQDEDGRFFPVFIGKCWRSKRACCELHLDHNFKFVTYN